MKHWSTPNGCRELCPACAKEQAEAEGREIIIPTNLQLVLEYVIDREVRVPSSLSNFDNMIELIAAHDKARKEARIERMRAGIFKQSCAKHWKE